MREKEKTREVLLEEIQELQNKIEKLTKAEKVSLSNEDKLQSINQQLTASEQQLRASNQQLSATEQQLRSANQQLEANNQQLIASEQQIRVQAHDLGERVKELNCFHNISEIVKIRDISMDDILQKIVNIIPASWQYPKATCATITFIKKDYKTNNYKETKWKQNCEIVVNENKVGSIEVSYLEQQAASDEGPFLKEERKLLNSIAERIGRIIEHHQEGELKQFRNNISKSIERKTNIDQISDAILKQVFLLEEFDSGGIYLLDQDSGVLDLVKHKGLPQWFVDIVKHYEPENEQVKLVLKGKPVYQRASELPKTISTDLLKDGIQSLAVIPILHVDKVIGAINLASHTHAEVTGMSLKKVNVIAESNLGIAISHVMALETIQENENSMRTLFNTMKDIVFEMDYEGTYLFIAPTSPNLMFKSSDEAIGMKLHDLFPKSEADLFLKFIQKCLDENKADSIVYPLTLNNKTVWFEGIATPKTKNSVLYIARDITERKIARKRLEDEQARLINILDSIPDGIYIVSQQYDIEYINPVIEKEFGSVDNRKCYEYFHERTEPCLWCKNSDVFAGKSVRWEWYSNKNDKHYDLYDIPFKNADGNISKFEIFHDITKRKKTEEALKESEELFKSLVTTVPDIIIRTDIAGNVVFINNALIKIFPNFTKADFIGKSMMSFISEKDRQRAIENTKLMFEGALGVQEYQLKMDSNNYYDFAVNGEVLRDSDSKPTGMVYVLRDITERKLMENALQDSENKLRLMINNSHIGFSATDLKGNFTEINSAICEMIGYTSDDILGKHFDQFSHPDDAAQNLKLYNDLLENKITHFDLEKRYIHKNGSIVNVLIRSQIVRDNKGKPLFEMAITENITERKKAEKALKESEEKFRDLAGLLPQIVYETDIEGVLTFANEQAFKSFGYSIKDFDKGINVVDMIIPEEREKVNQNIHNLFSGKPIENHDYTALKNDGSTFPILIYSSIILKDDKPAGLRGIIIDYSEQKKMENILKESETRYRLLFNAASDAIFLMDEDRYVDCNLKTLEMFGCKKDEIVGYSPVKYSPAKQKDGIDTVDKTKTYINAVLSGEPQFFEWQHKRLDGEIFDAEVSLSLIEFSDGKHIQAIVRDITKRKKAENALRESEARFKALHNASFGGIAIHDKGLILECNKGLAGISGHKLEDLVGMDGLLLIAEESREMVMKNILAGFEEPYEAIGIRKNGKKYPLRLEAREIPFKGKEVRVVEFRDITESKKIEDNIKQRMTELEIFNDAAVDRELVINDLRKEINEIREKLGKDAKYEIVT